MGQRFRNLGLGLRRLEPGFRSLRLRSRSLGPGFRSRAPSFGRLELRPRNMGPRFWNLGLGFRSPGADRRLTSER